MKEEAHSLLQGEEQVHPLRHLKHEQGIELEDALAVVSGALLAARGLLGHQTRNWKDNLRSFRWMNHKRVGFHHIARNQRILFAQICGHLFLPWRRRFVKKKK